jgi:hyaluronoglucosaminidase
MKGSRMHEIGIVEGFFGPQWSAKARQDYASFLKQAGAHFYIYAPKQDSMLRKNWRASWSEEYLAGLRTLAQLYHENGIQFGVALSPFGLDKKLDDNDRHLLAQKMSQLQKIGIDILGVFFDDMPSFELLAEVQIEVVTFLKQHFLKKIIFCPTYYTYDPILEKVFGSMPKDYWKKIAEGIPMEVEIAWTGPKVISPEINLTHMQEVTVLLKRNPYIWENLFANDGPKNCKFLKLKPFSGREAGVMELSSGYAFNLMNQPYLSQLLFLASRNVLTLGQAPEEAFDSAMTALLSPELTQFLRKHGQEFLTDGLDKLTDFQRENYQQELSKMKDPAAQDIQDWLRGLTIVGSECLTD